MVKGSRARTVVLIIAAGIFILALVFRLIIGNDDELGRIAGELNAHGYDIYGEDIFVAGETRDSTIADALGDEDPAEAVAASIEAGFPSRVERRGDIVLMLAELENGDVVTVYLCDEDIELCFIQTPGAGEIRPLS